MSVMPLLRTALGAAVMACLAAPALAVPVTYTFTGTGTGVLGGTAFTDATFTISAATDTDLITTTVSLPATFHETPGLTGTSLSISGLAAATFTNATRFFSGNDGTSGGVGFGEAPVGGALGLDYLDILDNGIIGYDMRSAVGPVTVPSVIVAALVQFQNVGTSLGDVTFRAIRDVTFTAVTDTQTSVPEPTTLALVLAAAAAGTAVARRRQA